MVPPHLPRFFLCSLLRWRSEPASWAMARLGVPVFFFGFACESVVFVVLKVLKVRAHFEFGL